MIVYDFTNMRVSSLFYPNWNAVRTGLSWTHYRTLLRVENPSARQWRRKTMSSKQPATVSDGCLLITEACLKELGYGS